MANGWFVMTYALSLVKCDMFICVISNKDASSWFALDVIDLIKHLDVLIKFPVDVLIFDEVSHMGLQIVSFDGDWYDAIVSR